MTEQELWNAAVRQIAQGWDETSPPLAERLTGLLRRVGDCKETLHALAAAAGADRHCASCGGRCCHGGKHHVTIVDLLGYLALKEELFAPRFGASVCPYLGPDGCFMSPRYRPRTCIVFLCDAVLNGMGEADLAGVAGLERELDQLYGELGELLAISPGRSLLLAAESSIAKGVPLIDLAAERKE